MNRGDIFDVDLPVAGLHPAVVVSCQEAIPFLSSVTVVPVTLGSRGHPAEMALGEAHGLPEDSVANCDTIFTISKVRFGNYRGSLTPDEARQLNSALRVALGVE